MNDQLGPAARALLDAAREGLGPDPAAAARVKAKVAAAAVAGGATASLAGKLALLATAGAIAGGAVYATRDRGPEPAVVVAPAIVSAAPAREPVPPPAVNEHDDRAERDVGEIELEPAVISPEPATPRRARPRRSRPAIELGREVELVDAAIRALRGGDPRGALAAVASHTRETAGKGQLAEDAAAIEIEALCALGDPGVAARLAAFDARWPRSAQRARLTTSCP